MESRKREEGIPEGMNKRISVSISIGIPEKFSEESWEKILQGEIPKRNTEAMNGESQKESRSKSQKMPTGISEKSREQSMQKSQ